MATSSSAAPPRSDDDATCQPPYESYPPKPPCQQFLGALFYEFERWPQQTLTDAHKSPQVLNGLASCLTPAEADAFVLRQAQSRDAIEYYCRGGVGCSRDLARQFAKDQQDVLWGKLGGAQKARVWFRSAAASTFPSRY